MAPVRTLGQSVHVEYQPWHIPYRIDIAAYLTAILALTAAQGLEGILVARYVLRLYLRANVHHLAVYGCYVTHPFVPSFY